MERTNAMPSACTSTTMAWASSTTRRRKRRTFPGNAVFPIQPLVAPKRDVTLFADGESVDGHDYVPREQLLVCEQEQEQEGEEEGEEEEEEEEEQEQEQ